MSIQHTPKMDLSLELALHLSMRQIKHCCHSIRGGIVHRLRLYITFHETERSQQYTSLYVRYRDITKVYELKGLLSELLATFSSAIVAGICRANKSTLPSACSGVTTTCCIPCTECQNGVYHDLRNSITFKIPLK